MMRIQDAFLPHARGSVLYWLLVASLQLNRYYGLKHTGTVVKELQDIHKEGSGTRLRDIQSMQQESIGALGGTGDLQQENRKVVSNRPQNILDRQEEGPWSNEHVPQQDTFNLLLKSSPATLVNISVTFEKNLPYWMRGEHVSESFNSLRILH